jgi:hypothetical protein
MKRILKYLAIIFIANFSFLFSPPSNFHAIGHHTYVPLNNCMGFTSNGDSFIFVVGAMQPSSLLHQSRSRQTRALYIFAGTLIGNIIYYISSPLHQNIKKYIVQKNIFQNSYNAIRPDKGTKYFLFYMGYVILNIFILLISFILFEKIITALSGNWKNGSVLFAMILFMLTSNQQTKLFFWTPHQQLFNILTPLLCVYLGIIIFKKNVNYFTLLLISLGLGLLLLTCGNFLLTLPMLLFGYLYTEKKRTGKLKVNHIPKSLLISILFFLTLTCWIAYLRFAGVIFYSPEIEKYREFIWIVDALKLPIHSSFRILLSHTFHFFQTFGSLCIPVFLIGVTLLLIKKGSLQYIKIHMNSLLLGSFYLLLFIFIETFIFLWLLGYYGDRLTFSFFPLLLCFFALLLNSEKLSFKTKCFITALMVLIHLYNIFAIPVHFSDRLFYS